MRFCSRYARHVFDFISKEPGLSTRKYASLKTLSIALARLWIKIACMPEPKIYSFEVKSIDGKTTTLSPYKGKAMLIVNVASQCGFTSQYGGLEALYNKYHEKGFEVLGFPCNQFGSQEPGDEAEIKNFCELNYSVSFPLFAKIDVNGENAHPLYQFLKSEEKGIFGTEAIKWNFTKFLIDREGNVLKRFAPQTKPEDLESEVEAALKT
jgi:glutathione peroxidase